MYEIVLGVCKKWGESHWTLLTMYVGTGCMCTQDMFNQLTVLGARIGAQSAFVDLFVYMQMHMCIQACFAWKGGETPMAGIQVKTCIPYYIRNANSLLLTSLHAVMCMTM